MDHGRHERLVLGDQDELRRIAGPRGDQGAEPAGPAHGPAALRSGAGHRRSLSPANGEEQPR